MPSISAIPNTLFLNSGNFTLSASGGADVAAFNVPFVMPSAFTWTNRNSLNSVTRSQPQTLSWTGVAATSTVFIAGGGVDILNNASTEFVCLVPPGASTFTVPAATLANISAQHQRPSQCLGVIYIGTLASPTTFTASGISGQLLPAKILGKSVSFQ